MAIEEMAESRTELKMHKMSLENLIVPDSKKKKKPPSPKKLTITEVYQSDTTANLKSSQKV